MLISFDKDHDLEDKPPFRVYLALGSNVGDRTSNLASAMQYLDQGRLSVATASSIYETAPWGLQDQQAFLNQVVCVETGKKAIDVLAAIREIEDLVGRRPTHKWGPREIDIDLILYGDRIIDSPHLIVPHPYIIYRRFVLKPLCDINSEGIHPVYQKTFAILLANCLDESEVKPISVQA